jgi:hypothetical protein
MSAEKTELPESTVQRRYAPPEAVAGLEVYPKPVSFIGFVLYLAFAVAFVAAAFELFPLGGPASSRTIMFGGVVGAYTWGRYGRSRWVGFGIGLLVSFLVIGLAIYLRHAIT